MVGTRKSTMQGVGNPVSATDLGDKAGPQASSSNDRSSTWVGNLAFEEYNVTRKPSCNNNVDSFCVVCGEYVVSKLRKTFANTLKTRYREFFGIDAVINHWTSQTIYLRCSLQLNKQKKRTIASPMIWREPGNHEKDCYFCLTNVYGHNRKTKSLISYASVESVTLPTFLSAELINESNITTDENKSATETSTDEVSAGSDVEDVEMHHETSEESSDETDKNPNVFTQEELNDLVRDAGLSKEISELLASRLKEKNCLAPGTLITFYRDRDIQFRKYFTDVENLVYCNNIEGLINEYNISYEANNWRLFIDSSTRSLKAVLLHNGNQYAPLPVGHSVALNEEYHNLRFLLEKLDYDKHKWQICGDLKIMTILLGQQSGFTKYPCFICEWDSRARDEHYVKKEWPLRNNDFRIEKCYKTESNTNKQSNSSTTTYKAGTSKTV